MSIIDTLSSIAENVNTEIQWAVGGSLLLKFYSIIESPNDIDILVNERDVLSLNKTIKKISEQKDAIHKKPFQTKYFTKYEVNNIGIDIMGGFAIKHDQGIYRLAFDKESIVNYKDINGVPIPLTALEDWYVLYQLIPGKKEKATLIEEYLKNNGVKYPNLIQDALRQPLPYKVRERLICIIS